MITMLRLANFRRHADLELRFDDAGQIVLVAGRNGVGKTTLLEAITYALYAEGRHGRRNLDQLLRRGAELEGMEVEMAFTVGDDRYRVLRRRDGKASTAVLYANDHPLVEGQREVTEEITRVLGMDSAGFRLATIAQQKDLDGLASLTPTTRTRMVTRLLRLDALTRARDAASEMHHTEAKIAAQLRPLQPLEQFEQACRETSAQLAASQAEKDRTTAAVAALRAELDASVSFLAEWQETHERLARSNAELAIAEADQQRLTTDLSAIEVPRIEAGETPEDLSVLAAEVAMSEREIAAAEAARVGAEHRRSVHAELLLVEKRLEEIGVSSTKPAAEAALVAAETDAAQLRADLTAVARELQDLSAENNSLSLREHELTSRIERVAALGSDCDSCGQAIGEQHRHQQRAQLERQLLELQTAAGPLRARITELTQRSGALSTDCADVERTLSKYRTEVDAACRADEERKELLRRQATYRDQISRLPETSTNLDALYARKADLAVRVARSQAAVEAERERNSALLRRAQAEAALAAATARVAAAREAVEANTPSDDLQQQYRAYELTRTRLQAEEQLLAFNSTETAVVLERLSAAEQALQRAQAEDERRRRHQSVALHAGNAKRLLSDVADRLSTTVRPALEGAVSTLLAAMSEGRFTKVSVSEDYELRVEDDGKMRALNELSGGEADLVALATRLALAQIVSERHGAGGAGFLILDEPLGSQDPVRRQSILAGLRALRGTYDQIFLISHVDGIEDAADTVVHISTSADRSETVVDVT